MATLALWPEGNFRNPPAIYPTQTHPATRPSWIPQSLSSVFLCHVVMGLYLSSLQWNFIQAGAARALGQALQLNRTLTTLE